MRLIVGLGNKGKKYKWTRHNLGFEVVDALAKKYNKEFNNQKFNAKLTSINLNNENIILVKPYTFVNLSGSAVNNLLNYYKLDNNSLIVICDDINLPIGKIRIRKKGSHGSHKGLKSIIDNIHTEEFIRIRIGISKPKIDNNYNLADYVLSKFEKDELVKIKEVINLTITAIEEIIKEGVDYVMNKINPIKL